TRGEVALRKHAERFGDVARGAPLYYNRADLARTLAGLSPEERTRLERVAARIRAFAVAQRGALGPVSVPVPGGVAEHRIAPMQRAGCYAPGGRYALPSSVLMTAVTARVAGVRDIWVASPKPQGLTLARQLGDLPTARVARAALAHGGAIVVSGVDEGIAACDAIAPEHLQLQLRDADAVAPRLAHYGALFVGAASAEVLGDYGAGPNHVLPTGGTARSSGGL